MRQLNVHAEAAPTAQCIATLLSCCRRPDQRLTFACSSSSMVKLRSSICKVSTEAWLGNGARFLQHACMLRKWHLSPAREWTAVPDQTDWNTHVALIHRALHHPADACPVQRTATHQWPSLQHAFSLRLSKAPQHDANSRSTRESPADAASACVWQLQASFEARVKDVCILRKMPPLSMSIGREIGQAACAGGQHTHLLTLGTSTATEEPSAPINVTIALPVAATCFLSFTMSLQKESAA